MAQAMQGFEDSIVAENQAFIQKPKEAKFFMDQLVKVLQKECSDHSTWGLSICEIIKGGSLGQGTAVPGHFDLDMVVFSRDIDPADFMRGDYTKTLLKKFDKMLSTKFAEKYKKERFTPHALQFILTFTFAGSISTHELEVDLLPCPYFEEPEDFYQYLKPIRSRKRRKFSCTVAKWLMDFFSNQPNEVKEYIRRAKIWRNAVWSKDKNSEGKPKSILIALLVIKASSDGAEKDPKAITANMINYVQNHDELRIHWTFDGATYDQKYVGYFRRPYIIDPSNPFNNLYISGIGRYRANSLEGNYERGDGNWSVFAANVHTMDLSRVNGTRV